MQISSSGTIHNQQVYSDANEFRNEDYISDNDGGFIRGISQGGVAAEYGHVQVYNPNGSGVVVLVDRINVSLGAVGIIAFAMYDTELVVDVGAWVNVRNAGAAGTAHIRKTSNGSLLGVTMWTERILADTVIQISLKVPILLAESEGVLAQCIGVNIAINVAFFGREV